MFDFAWSELALIGVVALVLIGPKDLPVAIKAVAETIKKARRMAGEFQTHVDEMVREANLSEVRDQFNDLRRMDIKNQILRAVDDDGSIRKTLSDPLVDFTPPPPAVPVHDSTPPIPEVTVAEQATHEIPPPDIAAPAFVPPSYVQPEPPAAPAAPAFVPPAAASAHPEHA
jgi:sec-independent protein translocase protein TatB